LKLNVEMLLVALWNFSVVFNLETTAVSVHFHSNLLHDLLFTVFLPYTGELKLTPDVLFCHTGKHLCPKIAAYFMIQTPHSHKANANHSAHFGFMNYSFQMNTSYTMCA